MSRAGAEAGRALSVRTRSGAATERVAGALAALLPPGTVLALEGPLGAGKTTFVRGLVRGLGGTMRVKSPTFALAHSYETTPEVHHLDLYRLDDEEAAFALGLDELLHDPAALIAVEWADRAPELWRGGPFVRVCFPDNASRTRALRLELSPGLEVPDDLGALLERAAAGRARAS